MNRKAFVYCCFDNSKIYNSFKFQFEGLRKLKRVWDNPQTFEGFDIVFVQDKTSEALIQRMCVQEGIDLSKMNFVSHIPVPELEDAQNKCFYMVLRFLEFANPQYDYVWMKDLDHSLDKNDVDIFNDFVDSEYDFASIPNCPHALKAPAVGDMGIKTFKHRDLFNSDFQEKILDYVKNHHQEMKYGFDMGYMCRILDEHIGIKQMFSDKMKVYIWNDKWRYERFKQLDLDMSGKNFMLFNPHPIKYYGLKHESWKDKTYTIDGVARSYEIPDNYRGFSISSK